MKYDIHFEDDSEKMFDPIISEDMKLAARKGAVWLDQNYPEWVNTVDLGELNMLSCYRCVIGQVVGDYYDLVRRGHESDLESESAYMSEEWAEEHGFVTARFLGDYDEVLHEYKKLETVWTDEVKQRLG